MKRNKLFIYIVILTLIFLFGMAAIFDQCSILTGSKVDEEEEKESEENAIEKKEKPEEETIEEEIVEESSEEEITEQTEEETEEPEEALQAPTIDLLIYEGPTYSADDDVCYFRIEAIVTGNPAPVINFSKDDSSGAWGSLKTQINLNDTSETYTLVATATNSKGSDETSIDLSWGCSPITKEGNNNPIITDITFSNPPIVPNVKYDVTAFASDPDADSLTYQWNVTGGSIDDNSANPMIWTAPNTVGSYSITVVADDGNGGTATRTETVDVIYQQMGMTTELPIYSDESGFLYNAPGVYIGPYYQVGDDGSNYTYKSFISFDISQISGATVNSAHLWFYSHDQKGDLTLFKPLYMLSAQWTPVPDFDTPGEVLGEFSYHNFGCTSPQLKTELQQAIEDGRDRFQVIILFTGMATDNDNDLDMWYYRNSDIRFDVSFTP